MNHRFRIGDRVRVTGILAEFYPGKTGNVHETLGYSPNSLPQSSTGRRTESLARNPRVKIEDLGDSKRLLANKEYFRRKAQTLVSRGIVPTEAGLGGWLGRYEAALVHALGTIENKSREPIGKTKPRER